MRGGKRLSKPVFPDKARQPTSEDLRAVLGSAASLLGEIEEFLEAGGRRPRRAWKFYSKAAGWTVAVASNERTVFHLLPHEGAFTVVFTFGQRAVDAAREAALPAGIATLIEEAQVYAEGRSFRFAVGSRADVASVLELVRIKLAH